MDSVSTTILSDLFVNLSAAWIGVIFIVPNFTKAKGKRKWGILTIDSIFSIVSLVVAYALRKLP